MTAFATAKSAPPSFFPDGLPPESVIFGRSDAMRRIEKRIGKIANVNIPVLIQGETGTGKEIIARLIHRLSSCRAGPFIRVDCPSIPGTLLESELFGYERGAFTGAHGSKPGRVELAHRGTLFLDEISELDLGLQAKLLQLLQDGQFCRIGATADSRVEVRFLCATNRRLTEATQAGTFRQDLLYRINALSFQLPPLRERREDIPDLVDYFLRAFNREFNCQAPRLDSSTMHFLMEQNWPGNIRELENLIKRYVVLGITDAPLLEVTSGFSAELAPYLPLKGPISLKKIVREAAREFEHKIILTALESEHWSRRRAAERLNISYRGLLKKIRGSGIPTSSRGRGNSVEGRRYPAGRGEERYDQGASRSSKLPV
jgi:two-component system response regulator AtoC